MDSITIKQTMQKHAVLICVAISVVLIVIAASVYPGGSLLDKNSQGFDWTKNFISNLFQEKAINGLENRSRVWAIIGMAFHAVGYGLFFIEMSKRILVKQASTVLKVVGTVNIVFNFLIATPLHDLMIVISSTLSLLGLFYITVFILKSKLHVLKICCILCLLIFYYTLFLYGSGDWRLLAIMQKVSAVCSMSLILGILYFTKVEDFNPVVPGIQKI